MNANDRRSGYGIVPFILIVLSLGRAQGPKAAYFYNPATDLPWARGEIYMDGGSRLKIPFLPVVLARFGRAPMGTENYGKDVSVDAPLVFVGNGIVQDGVWNCYQGRRANYTTGEIDVAGKAVVFCNDSPDTIAEKLKAEFPLEKRIAAAARRKAAAVIIFSSVEEYPFLMARFAQASEVPDIPAVTITKSSFRDLFLGDFDVDDASIMKKWRDSGLPPEAVELSAKLRLEIGGAFAKAETSHFLFRARPSELSNEDLTNIARVNEKSLESLLACFRDDPGLTWKKSLVVYFRDYDSKIFYTHHWGRGLGTDEGSYMVHAGGAPDIGLAAHENAHTLIESNWGGSTSFLAEGIGRYVEAEATNKDMNHLEVVRFLAAGQLFPLDEMLTYRIGTGGLKTEVGYPAAGSFVGFLVQSRGLAALKMAYQLEGRSPAEREKEDTWRKAYRKSIRGLEKDWLEWLGGKFKVEEKVIAEHLKKSAAPKAVKSVDPRLLETLVGRYAVSGGTSMVLTILKENDRLFLEVPNMGKMALLPESDLKFAVQGFDATAAFVKDEKGEIIQMVFHTAAGDMTANRIK